MSVSNSGVWLLESGGQFVVKEAPFSKPGDDEVLIQNKAVAINPMDWKIQAFGPHLPFPAHYPFIIGSDVAGEVYEVGKDVTAFKKGDRVIGLANWFLTNDVKDSAFQHYSICKASVVAALPDNISFEAGSVLPLGLSTAAMGVYPAGRLELPLPDATRPSTIDKVVLIWGGSSSTGSAAIQLAVASGATVIATASEKNYDFVRSLGAAAVFDYRKDTITEDLVQAIKDTPGDFVGALDAIAEEKTWRACADVVKGLGGGRVVSNLPVGFTNVPEGVEVVGVYDTAHLSNNKEIVEAVWGKFVPVALKNGSLKPVPEPLVIGKGLEKIPEGIALCQQGISAGKVVVDL
ncbi:zinc-binding alcohol dehydrogenase family protein [Aspergillus chevalieri]|uniref:Putative secondary metabolism biosynthetic enzyme n=1 Tax=Aspergillus chevalieri TaxID=182096 RepID=A0A7R7VW57_ASPCH|nr:putative secondary metabolism biosynthetic enzyme [Aspergillus chevalieri]BCR91313.1 putative secondary metabolism biosynthetic enzyme [Aspergillus chevalieri]